MRTSNIQEMVKVASIIAVQDPVAASEDNKEYIESRFGKIKVDLDKTISFTYGLLGMPDKIKFCLANFPDNKFDDFKILQSIDDLSLSFITLPLGTIEAASYLIDKEDLLRCSEILKLPASNMLIFLITSIHNKINPENGDNETKISVNVRAPLIIDAENYLGIQYVLPQEKYLIQHIIY